MRNDFEKHVELHSYADNLSLAFHVCRVCNKIVNKKESNIQCSKCIYFFHKKCTSKKDNRGSWKPSVWSCHICSPPHNTNYSLQTLNPDAEPFQDPAINSLGSRTKLPPLTGRQRKSNVNLENPATDFLKSQVDTLKSVVSQNDAEIKKLKQSNDIKSKRINQLESQLQEATNLIAQQARVSKDPNPNPHTIPEDFAQNVPNPRTDLLEQKYDFLMSQVNMLTLRLSEIGNNRAQSTFACSKCEYETNLKADLSKHVEDTHERLYTCSQCDFKSESSQEISEHKRRVHQQKKYECAECEFETFQPKELEKHIRDIHSAPQFPCDACSYQAIHQRDLGRHMNTMHKIPLVCNKCDFNTLHTDNLRTHVKESHYQSRTFVSSNRNSGPSRQSIVNQPAKAANTSTKPGSSEQSSHQKFHCQGKCASPRKDFQHKDEFDLHMSFFHDESQQ